MPGKTDGTPSKAKIDSKQGKPTPAKRSLDQGVQLHDSTPKRRRCLSIKPSNQAGGSEDPNKTGSLHQLDPDRVKIPLPVTLNVIHVVDQRMQDLAPLYPPISPAMVPLDTIVNDFLIFKKFIRANKKATQDQIVQHAWGLSEMVRIFNENIRSHLLTTLEYKEFDKTLANASKRYGVIHLIRMISKLHVITMRLSFYEDIKEALPEFMKFIDTNYKKYWNREAEYPINKNSFEMITGIRWLE
ncbi:hypothetical protein B9Z55_023190 [Caenorhabditis nigoni]|uniref:MRG domain-containing protein n=1 Tax=Caenorhabditis nigoni TaxID=1611254 RepID=A0A2G5SP64_9PELO|nr:hypothetical protein B9Z55_023190 [Caenorhabditis nigoni]